MAFISILFEDSERREQEAIQEPSCFGDLNLDQIIAALTADFEEYDLKPFFYERLGDIDGIRYRQEVMEDLDNSIGMEAVRIFSDKMRLMRACLGQAKQLHYYPHTVKRRFLAAVGAYCDAVEFLHRDLSKFAPCSRGLQALREYLAQYVVSEPFRELFAQSKRLTDELSAVTYSLLMDDGSITVWSYNQEPDYSVAVEETFAKFSEDASSNHWAEVPEWSGMNHIEAQIQDRVGMLHPDLFRSLDDFCAVHNDYPDPTIERFDREVQFYVAYLRHVANLRKTGLEFCRPVLSQKSKETVASRTFDLALAGKLMRSKVNIVTNDFCLSGCERILVISGPNQGGKTTFARMFGQLHYLASLGCLVPGREARLFLYDHLFTHFERAEDATNLRGKLQDDLIRIRGILEAATPNTIIIMNEIFSSTTVKDAIFLSKKIMRRMSDLDLISVCVTFLDELASFNEKTVSMVSAVDPSNPAVRTFKVGRKPADGLAYALAIAEKYRVTYNWIRERVKA